MKKYWQFINEQSGDGEKFFEFEYEDTYSKDHTCRCSGTFKSLEDAIKFFGFEEDSRIISWKCISNGADNE